MYIIIMYIYIMYVYIYGLSYGYHAIWQIGYIPSYKCDK